jgi:RNA polymerase sigma-70 factor (ECF subfamily)
MIGNSTRRRDSQMELTYPATEPKQTPTLPRYFVDSSAGAFPRATTDAAAGSGAGSNNAVCRASVTVSARKHGDCSDEQLLAAARSGDDQAFVNLTSRYRASVQQKVFRILRNREDAEDALQEALFKAYTHLSGFRGDCKFSTWLTRIAINSALMQLRHARSHSEVSFHQRRNDGQTWEDLDFPDPSPNAEQMYAKRQTLRQLSHAVRRLPSSHRFIISEYHERERPMQEAADSLGITLSAAKSRLLRARLALRSVLKTKRMSMADAYF